MDKLILQLRNEQHTRKLGLQIYKILKNIPNVIICLEGEIGAGKTTLVRAIIKCFGFNKVKSPTYSLIENYTNNKYTIYHLDCYRLANFSELEYAGFRDILFNDSIIFVEWASKVGGLTNKDLSINLVNTKDNQIKADLRCFSTIGKEILDKIKNSINLVSF